MAPLSPLCPLHVPFAIPLSRSRSLEGVLSASPRDAVPLQYASHIQVFQIASGSGLGSACQPLILPIGDAAALFYIHHRPDLPLVQPHLPQPFRGVRIFEEAHAELGSIGIKLWFRQSLLAAQLRNGLPRTVTS